jgi:hypothetical protein
VGSRLLITLAVLPVSYPVHVVGFGDAGPGASAGMPLREMQIAGTGSPAYRAAELQHIRSSVLAQHSVFLPAHVSLVRLAGQYTVAMRDSGAPANTPPTLSASVQVTPSVAYTIVSMGPASHLGAANGSYLSNIVVGASQVRLLCGHG